MDAPRQPDSATTEPVGPGGAWRPSFGLLAVATGIVGGAFAWWWTSQPATAVAASNVASPPAAVPVTARAPAPAKAGPLHVVSAASVASPAVPVAAPPVQPTRIGRNRDPNGDQTPDLSDYVNEGEKPTMGQVIERLHQAGVYTGLGAFSPPGTRPPLVGLAVPEDFVLPEGYVRHYQATDDGQRIEAILMFAPDRALPGAAGQPVALPKDRVVPPELAPAGLPIRRVVIPAPADSGRPGS